ncbi:MAG: NADP-dependent oxidoreductase [Proteobacteria bacterium]|nr:NADP-dependent oxidoreductase [Pseudomonadota bacterium]
MRNSNRQWILKKRPVGDIKPGDLELVESPIPVPGPGEILVRTVYLSLDPTNRIWMSDMEQYMPPVELGEVMRGGTLSVVEQSNNPDFKPGDVVNTFTGWQEYAAVPMAQKMPPGVPLPAYMSVLGATGATAYFGLLDLGKPQPGETVVVSAAAGAVGSIVGQIAKLKGCRVVGIAGSDEKCRHLVKDFGFDACINYKTEKDMRAALKRECPNGIDIDFENAGGAILDAVMDNLAMKARIVLCGMISQYNATGQMAGTNITNILMKRARIEGFIIIDYLPRFGEFIAEMAPWVMQGKIKYDTTIVKGIESALPSLDMLFTGKNTGKLLIQVSDEPK